jgi:diacylglycerol kinase (ATP)
VGKNFSIKDRIQSFKYALTGLKLFFKTQYNARVHLAGLLLALILGFYFNLCVDEWISIVFAAGLVFVTEVINTSIEYLTDLVSPGQNEQAGKVKDLAAAAVLVAAIIALAIGCLIFIPKIVMFI